MYKKNDILKTVKGDAKILATKYESHVINGLDRFKNDGDQLFPSDSKDYIVAFENPENNSSLDYIQIQLTHNELLGFIID